MSNFVCEPFVNNVGQTIQPGDKVFAVASGYGHSISFRNDCVFKGVRRGRASRWEIKLDESGQRVLNSKGYAEWHNVVTENAVVGTVVEHSYRVGDGEPRTYVTTLRLGRIYKLA